MPDTPEGSTSRRRRGDGPRRPTISDVARRANVSVASVSYALNGAPGVSDELRHRIIALAQEMGWQPNQVARQLRTGVMDVLGLVLINIANSFYADLASGVIEAAAHNGYKVLVSHVGDGPTHGADAAVTYRDPLAGLLFTTLTPDDLGLLTEISRRRTPFVQVLRSVDGVDADWIGVDDLAAGTAMGEHVASAGRRRIAILGGPRESSTSRDRGLGFIAGAESAGGVIVNKRSMWGGLTQGTGYKRAKALFRQHPDVDAVMCGNDVIALGALDACRDLGIRVPQDVALSGFDDLSFSRANRPQLTTVTVPWAQLGWQSVEMLLSRMSDPAAPRRRVSLPHTIQIRETTVR